MFDGFRQYAKSELKARKIAYAELAKKTGFAENTIKCFMCGRDNSRKVAEKIADFLGVKLVYSDQKYTIEENHKEEN